jgi:hypothetical protein
LRYLFARYPKVMSQALAIVYRTIATHLIKKAGSTHKTAKTGGITLIQRFGSALNLNVHFHMLLLDGVYTINRYGKCRFQYVSAPLSDELISLVHTISHRIARILERQGLLERDMEQSYLTLEGDDDPMSQIHVHSITYRIAVGAQQGQKVFTLQTLPPSDNESNEAQIGQIAGFSLHAGIMARRDQRKKLERLCRYICRPAVSEKRLAMTSGGRIRYQLKTPYRDGTTHVFFQPLDFIARLAALVPKPRVNLTRYHGVLAPNSKHRVLVTPAHRGKGSKKQISHENEADTLFAKKRGMTWAQRLKRVFNIDIDQCERCGKQMKVIACIEDPVVIKKILAYLKEQTPVKIKHVIPESRSPPQSDLFAD